MKLTNILNSLITLLLENKNIKNCSYQITDSSKEPFDGILDVEYIDKTHSTIALLFKKISYPKNIEEGCKQINSLNLNLYFILIAPNISEISASICKKYNVGYFDSAGNCFINFDNIYIHISGNKNENIPKSRGLNSIYERSSIVSSKILRLLCNDINKKWKLKEISEIIGCSIGQVSKVKNFLLDNAQITQTKDGIQLLKPEEIMKHWASVYGKKENETITCYSFDSISTIESKLAQMEKEIGIPYYLTGFSGGSRYQPVVRYHKVHCYIMPEYIETVISYLECKKVKTGSNIDFIIPYDKIILNQSKEVNGSKVVSPIQLYLDCMSLKNRGEELAEAILRKEILHHDT